VHIEGERGFDEPPDEVYRALTDPDALDNAFSVIERIDAVGADWTVVVRLPLSGSFTVKLSVLLEELRRAEHARLRASGKSLGGRISVDTSFDLEPAGTGTLMRWSAEIDAAGIFKGLGSQALSPVATQHADRALGRIVQGPVTSLH
jgi:carbon monoxide dehydrogenase subunit G